jgi:hypothetical protein
MGAEDLPRVSSPEPQTGGSLSRLCSIARS